MDKAYILQNKLNENKIILSNLTELNQDMKNYFDKKSIICYDKCSDMDVNFDSVVNNIILTNCDNINLTVVGLVVGLEIERSSNITIICKKNMISNITINKSNGINIVLPNKDTYCDINKSSNIKIQDENGSFIYK
jgi:hypothetical protein